MDKIEHTIFRNLINNPTFVQKAYPYLKLEYFQDSVDRVVFSHISDYITEYNSSPTMESLVISLQNDHEVPEKVYTDSVKLVYTLNDVDPNTNLDWLLKESEDFCKNKALHNAIMKSIKIIDGDEKDFKPDAIPSILTDALGVCFDTAIGHDFYDNAMERYEHYHKKEEKIPFDIEWFNKITDGGLPRKTLTVLLAGCVHPDTKVTIRVNDSVTTTEISKIDSLLKLGNTVEILGADGFVPVTEFVDKGEWEEYILETSNATVRCNEDHLFDTQHGWIRAADMKGSGWRVLTDSGKYVDVISVRNTGVMIPIVDVVIDHPNQRYYTNGISSHNTNVGKSLIMCHMAAAFLAAGKNVLYITMEMSEYVTALRIDANLMDLDISSVKNIPKEKFISRVDKIKNKTKGRLVIKEYPTSGAHVGHFKALLNELRLKKDFVPDVIFLDYLNICQSQRVKNTGANSYTIIKSIAEELRGLAVEFNVPIVSATQSVRGANTKSDIEITDVSESFGLAATVDMLLGVIRTEDLDSKNQLMFKLLKSRFIDAASFGPFLVGVERSKMKLYDLESSAQQGLSQPQKTSYTPPTKHDDLVDIVKPAGNKGMDFSSFKFD